MKGGRKWRNKIEREFKKWSNNSMKWAKQLKKREKFMKKNQSNVAKPTMIFKLIKEL